MDLHEPCTAAYQWNTTSSWNSNWFTVETTYKKATKTLAYCLLFLVSLSGNTLILWAIYRDKRLRTNTNILIANMAVSDLLFPCFEIPKEIVTTIFDGEWFINDNFGLALCKLLPILTNASWTVSIYSCILIALDRYYAVAHPFLKGGFSKSRLKYILPGIWIFAVILCIPYVSNYKLLTQYYPYFGRFTSCVECWDLFGMPLSIAKDFQIFFLFGASFGIPFPVTVTLYLLIVYKLRKHKAPGQTLADTARIRREKQNKKVLKMSVAIVTLALVSWIFIHCYLFLSYYGKLSHLSSFTQKDLFFGAYFLVQMTSCYNFFIYLIFNDMYRANFKAILSPCFSVVHRRSNASEQTTNNRSSGNDLDIVKFERREHSCEIFEMHNLSLSN